MKNLTSKILIKRLQSELQRSHGYVISRSNNKLIFLKISSTSKFGAHVISINLKEGSFEVFLYPFRTNSHISSEVLIPKIESFISRIFNQIVDQNLSDALQNFREEVKNGL